MKKYCTFIVLILLLFKSQAQQAYINRTYNYFPAAKACIINDMGYVILTTKNTGTAQLISLVQLNFYGDTMWRRNAGLDGKKYDPINILPGVGGFAVVGTVYDSLNPKINNPRASDFFFALFTDSAVVNWINVFGKPYIGEVMGQAYLSSNGEYLLAGRSYRDTIGNRLYVLRVKLDSTASSVKSKWEQTYSTIGTNPIVHTVIETTDNGAVLAGEDGNGLRQSAMLMKIDKSGNKLWNNQYNFSNSAANKTEVAAAIILANNKGFEFVGTSFDNTYKSRPFYIAGVDSLGNKLWQKTYGDSTKGQFWKPVSHIILNSDNSYNIAGEYYSNIYSNINPNKAFVLKFNANGDTVSSKYYRSRNDTINSFSGIVPTQYSGYLMCGHSGKTNDSAWVVKVDCMLNDSVQYAKQPNCCIFSGITSMDYSGSTVTICKGDSVIMAANPTTGFIYHWSTGSTKDTLIAKISGTYTVTITSSGGCSQTFSPATVVVDSILKPVIVQSGGLLQSNYATDNQWYWNGTAISGAFSQTYNPNGVGGSYTVVVTNACGTRTSQALVLTGIENLSNNNQAFKIYPNPFCNQITITQNVVKANAMLQLKDITGRVVFERNISNENTSEININTANFSEGVYLCSFMVDGKVLETRKIIKMRE